MNTKKYYLALTTVIGILCVPSLAIAETPQHDQQQPIEQANPALTGIQAVFIAIDAPGTDPNKYRWLRRDLDTQLIDRLQKTHLTINPSMAGNFWDSGILRVRLDLLGLHTSQKHVFHVQTSLQRVVNIPRHPDLHIEADVWKSEPVMQTVSTQDIPVVVSNKVLEQVDEFIHAYMLANSPGKRAVDAQVSDAASPIAAKSAPPAGQAVAESMYVASKNSEVFHRPECRWAQKIAEKNLVRYNSRDEAIKAGKRPCKMCKP
jgi:hypothetical protein